LILTSLGEIDGGVDVNVTTDDIFYHEMTGDIHCRRCLADGAGGCAHILGAFAQNLDLHDIWENLPCEVKIPISSQRDIWATVSIDWFHTNMEPHRAIVRWEDKEVCIISPSEGRMVIRSALFSLMLGDFDFNRSCSASTHSPREEMIWNKEVRQSDPNSTDKVAQLWTVYTTGICIPCNEKIEQALSGLTPDREGSSVWNRQ
jgi:hypothetical protein